MVITTQTSRLRFLNDAAHLLAPKARTVSASIGAEYRNILEENNLEMHDDHKRETCNACGNIMTPGASCKIQMEHERIGQTVQEPVGEDRHLISRKIPAIPSSRRTRGEKKKIWSYTCRRCNRKTRFPINQTRRPQSRSAATHATDIEPTTPKIEKKGLNQSMNQSLETAKPAPSATSSSKKRAKVRKQAGLYAMLAKNRSKEASSAQQSFDLMDFMKTA